MRVPHHISFLGSVMVIKWPHHSHYVIFLLRSIVSRLTGRRVLQNFRNVVRASGARVVPIVLLFHFHGVLIGRSCAIIRSVRVAPGADHLVQLVMVEPLTYILVQDYSLSVFNGRLDVSRIPWSVVLRMCFNNIVSDFGDVADVIAGSLLLPVNVHDLRLSHGHAWSRSHIRAFFVFLCRGSLSVIHQNEPIYAQDRAVLLVCGTRGVALFAALIANNLLLFVRLIETTLFFLISNSALYSFRRLYAGFRANTERAELSIFELFILGKRRDFVQLKP